MRPSRIATIDPRYGVGSAPGKVDSAVNFLMLAEVQGGLGRVSLRGEAAQHLFQDIKGRTMKQFVKSLVVGVGVMGMVVACEPGDGSETSNSNTDNTGSTGNVTDNTDSTGSAGGWYVLEMEDDPNNSTLAPCDKGNIKSPGADF